MNHKTYCVCGEEAVTTIAHISACEGCFSQYQEEGRQYLPMREREFFLSFIDKARENNDSSATDFVFYGY